MMEPRGGLLPCGNCCIAVAQDEFVAVESFGSFYQTLRPGLAVVGPDCFGACLSFKSLTSRVQLLTVKVNTKTKDNTFVTMHVDVQMSVIADQLQDAMYKMENIHEQLDSYVTDIARSRIPAITLDELFDKQDELATEIEGSLRQQMAQFGWQIHKALIVDLVIDPGVVRSINEINRQRRLRDAEVFASEAHKIRTVKQAEALADKAALAGQGTARQRAAIIDGLRQAISGADGAQVSSDDIRTLLLTTQYFETLGYIGSRPTSKTYFLPKEDPNDPESTMRSGIIQGQVGAQCMQEAMEDQVSPRAEETQRAAAAERQRELNEGQQRREEKRLEAQRRREKAAYQPPPQMNMDGGSSFTFQQQPPPAPAPRAPQAQQVTIQIQVPPGVGPGQMLQAQTPDGRTVQIQIPPGVGPGQMLQFTV